MTYEQFEERLRKTTSREKAYAMAVGYLKDRERFDWTGVYSLEGETLVLRAFVGSPTTHTRIPVGRGVCGTAVAERADQKVDDVTKLDNYLACSMDTRSELVVLIRSGETIYAQIDIDSSTQAAFSDDDVSEVKRVADAVASHIVDNPRMPDRPVPKAADQLLPSPEHFAKCAVCKRGIEWGSTWFKCTVSTCNRSRLALKFCSSACWDAHLPEARHRDPAFEEHQAPGRPV